MLVLGQPMLLLMHIKKKSSHILVLTDGHVLPNIDVFTKSLAHAHEHSWQLILSDLFGAGNRMMYFIINISNVLSPIALSLPISWLRCSKMLMTLKKIPGHKKEYSEKWVLVRP